MNVRLIFISIGAGLAAALLFQALAGGTALALPLFLLSPLPLAIAGLGWGPIAGAGAALVATGAIAALSMPMMAVAFALILAAPVVWLCRLASLWRQDEGSPAREWYPIGPMLAQGIVISAVAVVLVGIMVGYEPETLVQEMLDSYESLFATAQPGGAPMNRTELEPIAQLQAALLPYTTATLAVLMLVLNMWLGGRIALTSGLTERPWMPLWKARLPVSFAIAFLVALVATVLPGAAGHIAAVAVGALGFGFSLIGLAILHALTRGADSRTFILVGAYVMLVVAGLPMLVAMIAGLADTVFDFRARWGRRPNP